MNTLCLHGAEGRVVVCVCGEGCGVAKGEEVRRGRRRGAGREANNYKKKKKNLVGMSELITNSSDSSHCSRTIWWQPPHRPPTTHQTRLTPSNPPKNKNKSPGLMFTCTNWGFWLKKIIIIITNLKDQWLRFSSISWSECILQTILMLIQVYVSYSSCGARVKITPSADQQTGNLVAQCGSLLCFMSM